MVGCEGQTCSRGRILEIDTSNPNNLTAQLVRDYRSPQGLISHVMGSFQILQDPLHSLTSVFTSWGSNAEFTEHTLEGRLVRDVQYSPLDPRKAFGGLPAPYSYRVYKYDWHGYPPWAPNATTDGNGTIWVSWNGATEVQNWGVYGGYHEADLGVTRRVGYEDGNLNARLGESRPLQIIQKAGFETEIARSRFWPPFVKLAALDGNGKVIGTSDTLNIGLPAMGCQLDCMALQTILFP